MGLQRGMGSMKGLRNVRPNSKFAKVVKDPISDKEVLDD